MNNLITKRCDEFGLKYIDTYNVKKSNRTRKIIKFTCDKHIKYGEQEQEEYHFLNSKKSPCHYCNHKKLREIFRDEMNEINPNIEILSEYVNWNTKIKCRCKKCGYEWDGNSTTLLRGQNCWVCHHNELWNKRGRRTTKEAKKAIESINPHIEVIGEYSGFHEKIKCKCKIDGTIWESNYCNMIKKTIGCPTCKTRRARERYGIKNDDFINIVHNINPDVDLLEPYVNCHTYINFICNKHNYKFTASPSTFLSKHGLGCPFCTHEVGRSFNRMPDDVYEKLVSDLGYIFKGVFFEDGACFIRFICKEHENKGEQISRWSNMGSGKCPCGYCNGTKRDQEDFVDMIHRISPDLEILGQYTKARNRIKTRCTKCNFIWEPLAYNLMSGFGCPHCNCSKGELEIKRILDSWGLENIPQKKFENCKDKLCLRFDFYLPNHNTAIEFDGEQHFKPVKWYSSISDEQSEKAFELVKKHDEIKDEYCYQNNINLIRIPYWDKDDIEDILYDNFVKYKIIE